MNSNRCFLALLFALLVFAGCTSTPNEGAPLADEAHPVGWLADHGQEALIDLQSCQSCHGVDFTGADVGVSCFTCHLSGPPFTVHPASWGDDTVAGHQNFAEELSWTSCATSGCHGSDLQGGLFDGIETGPSCFTISGCHTTANNGPPPPVTHTLTYDEPADHGPDAKQNQLYCRNCHGRPDNIFDGGFVTPNYGGIGNCSACHPDAKAHPTDWQGNNDTGADGYTSRHWGVIETAIDISCSLCHNVTAPFPAGPIASAPSCFSSDFENANNQGLLSCHAGGPPGHDTNAFVRDGTCSSALCHSDGGLGIVSGDHKGDCLNCHVSDIDRTRRVGTNGDATQADLLVDPETASCLTCHDPVIFPTDAFHHLLPSFISRDCADCHGLNVVHNVSFNAATDLSAGSPCSDLGCHSGEVENWTNITTRHDQFNGNGTLFCDTCHKSTLQTSRTGTYNENRTVEDVIFDAMNAGTTVNCLDCHLDRQDSHSGHNATVFSFGADGCDAAGCHDAARYPAGSTPPEVVNDVHAAVCTTCHATAAGGLGTTIIGDAANGIDGDATLAAGPAYASATCLTCHPAGTYPATAIHHDHAEYLAGNCTFCHAGGAPGHPADFAPSSGGCEACHSNLDNVVNVIHGGQCTTCHSTVAGGIGTTILGDPANGVDGDARLADGTSVAGSWGTVTCLTCHPAATYPSDTIHHDRTESTSGTCTFCHADPRPDWQGLFSLTCPTPFPAKLACVICHVEPAGTGLVIYRNRFTDNGGVVDQIKSGANPAAQYDALTKLWNSLGSDVLTDPAPGVTVPFVDQSVIAHQITHTAQINVDNFGICLGCHNPAGGPTGSATPVNVWHGRQEYSEIPVDSSTDAYNMHFDVLRKAPGRDFFGIWRGTDPGDNLPATPPFFSHGKELYRPGGGVAKDRGLATFKTFGKRIGIDGNESLWRDTTKAVTFTPLTIPCFARNDAEGRCGGATTDVPEIP